MKRFNFKEKFSKGKAVYTMAAVSFCLAVIAIGIVYSQTMNTLRDSLTEISTTRQVHQNQTGVTDPREITTVMPITTTAPVITTTEVTFEEENTEAPSTKNASATTAVSAQTSQSFIRPHDGEILRDYSPDVPLYCETMNDWRTHNGIDIAIKEGDEAVSVGKGKVSKVFIDSSFGYTVEVDYGSFTARYCGMKQGECVTINQSLEKGDSIGVIASVPCEAKSQPHLHFETLVNGEQTDPAKTCKW